MIFSSTPIKREMNHKPSTDWDLDTEFQHDKWDTFPPSFPFQKKIQTNKFNYKLTLLSIHKISKPLEQPRIPHEHKQYPLQKDPSAFWATDDKLNSWIITIPANALQKFFRLLSLIHPPNSFCSKKRCS